MIEIKPSIFASEVIGANLMVSMTNVDGLARPSTVGEFPIGVSNSEIPSLAKVVFQEGDYVTLVANGTIAVGDLVGPSTSGRCVKTTSWGQFVSIESASSGQTFLAKTI